MAITGIAHYNFRARRDLLDSLRDFYVVVVGLQPGPRPAFGSFGYWLYAGDQDLLHLSEEASEDSRRIGRDLTFDHVAFECTDWPAHERRLKSNAVEFDIDRVPGSGRLQVFFRDPAGNGIELIFGAGEA